jgi:mannosyltransferase OCH1-like enzyme
VLFVCATIQKNSNQILFAKYEKLSMFQIHIFEKNIVVDGIFLFIFTASLNIEKTTKTYPDFPLN